eukprot:8883520-Lingulodinium_polyedra.AAC.1
MPCASSLRGRPVSAQHLATPRLPASTVAGPAGGPTASKVPKAILAAQRSASPEGAIVGMIQES